MSRKLFWSAMVVSVSLAMASCDSPRPQKTAAEGQVLIQGAGAAFPNPLYEKWIEEFEKTDAWVVVSYAAVGSGEGVKRFQGGTVDFGASDAAMSDEQIGRVSRGVQLIPTTAGSIVLAYNLETVDGPLQLTRDVYVDIFLGKIKRWNDSRIAQINPELKLPATSIEVVGRQDASGTTYAFTNHLAAVSDEWKTSKGVANKVDWPGATLAPGNDGVAGLIQRTPGAIGYVEYGMAKRTGLAMAHLQNKAGRFIEPTGNSGLATIVETKLPVSLRAYFPDPDGRNSYPIVTYTWLLLYKDYGDEQKAKAVKRFVRWCLTDGQQYCEQLGYIRLAPQVAGMALDALDQIK